MKFDEAIDAHAKWRWRLKSLVSGRGEKLSSATVARDDQCELGKWLHGEGRRFATREEFAAAERTHAAFHRCAGEVVRAVETNNRSRAEVILAPHGAFETASMDTITALRKLQKITGGGF